MGPEAVRYQFDTVEVQPAAFAVLRDGRAADLEPRAVRVLLYLIEHRDRAVTKDELIEAVWGVAVTDNALTRIVAQIRRELGDDAHRVRYIQTLPTMGYRFIADVKVVQASANPRRRTPWLISAAVAAALILAISVWQSARRGARGTAGGLRTVQITTSPGLDIGARFSPNGASIVYCSDRSGRFEIYRRPVVSNAGEIQVTSDGKQNVAPAWSPDGKWVAYHSVVQHGIWLVPATGGAPRRLTAFGSAPAWSPDGQWIAFRSTEPISFAWSDSSAFMGSTVWITAADGSQLRQVTRPATPPGAHLMPGWSPDGKRLCFVALERESSIWSVDPASGKTEMLIKTGRDLPRQPVIGHTRLADPAYSPAGKGLYFSAINERGEYAIYCLPRSGERPAEMHSTGREAPSALAFSTDGKRLIFTRLSNISQLDIVTPAGDPKPLFQDAVLRASNPTFSPDGKHLAFGVEMAGRKQDLWIMNADGTGAAPVSSDPGLKRGDTWNREGALLYTYTDAGRIEFRRYDPARRTNEVVHSWPSSPKFFLPVLMPDEREVLSSCSTPLNVCLTPLRDGPTRQITFERERGAFPKVSYDGQWIVHEVRRGDTAQIGITDRDGGYRNVLTDDPGLTWANSFSKDSRRVAYAAYRDGVWNVWWIDRITRERRQVTHYTAYGSFVRCPAWRPGTEEIVYEHSQAKGNAYVVSLP